ncbi:unnamed protein product, partial [marine sediment metagenome]
MAKSLRIFSEKYKHMIRKDLMLNSSDDVKIMYEHWFKSLVTRYKAEPKCAKCEKVVEVGQVVVTHSIGNRNRNQGYFHVGCWRAR